MIGEGGKIEWKLNVRAVSIGQKGKKLMGKLKMAAGDVISIGR